MKRIYFLLGIFCFLFVISARLISQNNDSDVTNYDYKAIRKGVINKYLDILESNLNPKFKPKESSYDTLISYIYGGELFDSKMKWLNDKQNMKRFFNQFIYYSTLDLGEDNSWNKEKSIPYFEIHYTNSNIFYLSITFDCFEDSFIKEWQYNGFLDIEEIEFIKKRINRVLGVSSKGKDGFYNWDTPSIQGELNSTHLNLYLKKYAGRGWDNRSAVFELYRLKEWMYQDDILPYGSVGKFITNYPLVNGYKDYHWSMNINDCKKLVLKNEINYELKLSPENKNIYFYTKIAGKYAIANFAFLKTGLGQIVFNFPKSLDLVNKEATNVNFAHDLDGAESLTKDLLKLIISKYGIYNHFFDVSVNDSDHYFGRGDNIRIKEYVWNFAKTNICISIDKEKGSEEIYLVELWYTKNNYFEEREKEWKEDL